MHRHKLDGVENKCNSHNLIFLATFVPENYQNWRKLVAFLHFCLLFGDTVPKYAGNWNWPCSRKAVSEKRLIALLQSNKTAVNQLIVTASSVRPTHIYTYTTSTQPGHPSRIATCMTAVKTRHVHLSPPQCDLIWQAMFHSTEIPFRALSYKKTIRHAT